MFWFWFWLIAHLCMLMSDVAWWVLVLRWTKTTRWRVVAGVFLLAQATGLYLLRCGVDWTRYAPRFVHLAVATWHYFALGVGLTVLLPLALLRAWAWLRLRRNRKRENRSEGSEAAPANALKRREFLGACAALVPPTVTIGLTGISLGQLSGFRVRRFTLSLPTLPRALDGLTIAHLSDLHLGGMTPGHLLRNMVSTTNSLRPDMVVMTGDLIDYHLDDLAEGIALVKTLEGRHGVWLVEGNHDVAQDGAEFGRRVKAAGLRLLTDGSDVAVVRGHPVEVFGLSWMGDGSQLDGVIARQMRQLLKHRQPDAFPILLSHHPHAFDAAARAGLPLTLAGHTHGGECMLSRHCGLGPLLFRYWSGLYSREHSHLLVSNGVGNWLPVRINAPAETLHITLRCA